MSTYLLLLACVLFFLAGLSVGRAWGFSEAIDERDPHL